MSRDTSVDQYTSAGLTIIASFGLSLLLAVLTSVLLAFA